MRTGKSFIKHFKIVIIKLLFGHLDVFKKFASTVVLDSENSEQCIDFTVVFFSENTFQGCRNAPIFTCDMSKDQKIGSRR